MSKFMEDARVIGQEEVASHTYLMRLRAERTAREARAGQFFMLQVREGIDPLLRRPFSFHRIHPQEGIVELLYRVVGKGTWWLSQCGPQDRLGMIGPLGNGFEPSGEGRAPVVVVAGGIGIAPLVQLLESLAALRHSGEGGSPRDVHLFYGARTAGELLPAGWLEPLGIHIHWSTDDGSFGHHGFVTQLLRDVTGDMEVKPSVVYACGPLAMQFHVARWALENRIESQLSLESLMACGIGACLGCALPASPSAEHPGERYVHVCKDGPIFKAETIQWHKIQMHSQAPPTFLFS